MTKIFLLLMIMSMPGQPSVRYNASIYPTEDLCIQAREGYMEAFEAKPQEYKDKLVTEAFCFPFESFPIKGMQAPIGA
tara:strand:- start:108 stop:341 length:234 start_codon:yes stop_codon:yes gene_type:complete